MNFTLINSSKTKTSWQSCVFDIVQYQLELTEASPKSCLRDLQQM